MAVVRPCELQGGAPFAKHEARAVDMQRLAGADTDGGPERGDIRAELDHVARIRQRKGMRFARDVL